MAPTGSIKCVFSQKWAKDQKKQRNQKEQISGKSDEQMDQACYKQQMRLKLKQSNSNAKQFLLPYLKNIQPRNYTPRSKAINRSLTKIPQLLHHQSYAYPPPRSKVVSHDKPLLKEKLRSAHDKKKLYTPAINHDDTFASSNQQEQASITQITHNLKRQIEKNLVLIKKEKQNRKRIGIAINKPRYRTPRHQTQQNETKKQTPKKAPKCVTQEHEVFRKINQIIEKSQSKSSTLIDQPAQISYSSYLGKNNCTSPFASIEELDLGKKPVKTEAISDAFLMNSSYYKKKSIKNSNNYHQWRKVSIDESEMSKKVSYNLSSYEHEADRLEKIRNKNELSLKKYIQGKSYLSKLIKYRDSASLLAKEK